MRAACEEWTWCISFGCHRHRAIAWTEATNLRRGIRRCCRRSKGPAVVHVFAARPRAPRGVGFQRQAFSGGLDSPGLRGRFPVSTRGIHAFALWGRAPRPVGTTLARTQVRMESGVSKLSSFQPRKPSAQVRTGRGSHPGSHCEPDPGCRLLPGGDSVRSFRAREAVTRDPGEFSETRKRRAAILSEGCKGGAAP